MRLLKKILKQIKDGYVTIYTILITIFAVIGVYNFAVWLVHLVFR